MKGAGRPVWIGLTTAAVALAFIVGAITSRTDGTACNAGASRMARVELVFGLSRRAQPDVTDTEWTSFLNAEITPRFPDGLTILDAYGQWRRPNGEITKEPSRMLVILYRASPAADDKIEAIRTAWKSRFSQDSVMRIDGSDCVRF